MKTSHTQQAYKVSLVTERTLFYESFSTAERVTNSKMVNEYFRPQFAPFMEDHEEFWCIALNRNNKPVAITQIGKGGLHSCVADPKQVYTFALLAKACAIIVAHNHPSGNMEASKEDLNLTKKLVEVGEVLEIPCLDHLILGPDGYLSMADHGLMIL